MTPKQIRIGQPCTASRHSWDRLTFVCRNCKGVANTALQHSLRGAWKAHQKPKQPKQPEKVFYSCPTLTPYAEQLIAAAEKSNWIPKSARGKGYVPDHAVKHRTYHPSGIDTTPRRNGMALAF